MLKINLINSISIFFNLPYSLIVGIFFYFSASLMATDYNKELVDQEVPFKTYTLPLSFETLITSTFEKVILFNDLFYRNEVIDTTHVVKNFVSRGQDKQKIKATVTYLKGKKDCVMPGGTYEDISLIEFFLLIRNKLKYNEYLYRVEGIMIDFYEKARDSNMKSSGSLCIPVFCKKKSPKKKKEKYNWFGSFWGKVARHQL